MKLETLDLLFTKEKEEDNNDTVIKNGTIERKSASNIVSKETLRKIQKSTLADLSEMLSKTYGPMGSNTLILRGNSKETLVAEYSKDGNKVLKSATYADPIEMSIQTQILDVTNFTDKEVGDGTTSATLLSNAIFAQFCEFESSITPYRLIKLFKDIVSKIQDNIIKKAKPLTIEDVYNICMISTNGNEEIANKITYEIYDKFGLDVFVDTAISNNEDDTIRVFDGLTLSEGYSDPAYINTHDGKVEIRNANIYAFNDPIDTPEMVSFAEKILFDNIIEPANSNGEFIPTVIISPKISRDAAGIIEKLVDYLYSFDSSDITAKPPVVIITNLLGGNMDTYYDATKLCGCKMIRKYIDLKLQEQDIEKGTAPTIENIHSFAGHCELLSADGSNTKFINPQEMYEKDEDNLFKEDEDGNYIKTTTYSNLLKFVEDALNNAIENSEDASTVGNLRKRLQSLKANYVEYMCGGITIADRDSARDLIQDAVRNCRSASKDGVGNAANFEGFRAAIEVYEELQNEESKKICLQIIKAYKDIITKLYSSVYDKNTVEEIIKKSLEVGSPLNISTDKFDGKVLTSIQTDIKILDAISKIVTIMFTANQCLVQAPQLNIYS